MKSTAQFIIEFVVLTAFIVVVIYGGGILSLVMQ